MTKELKDYSIQELYSELASRRHVAVCVFVEDDVRDGLIDGNVEPTEDALDYVFNWKISDSMCERGWELIHYAADEYKYEKRIAQ